MKHAGKMRRGFIARGFLVFDAPGPGTCSSVISERPSPEGKFSSKVETPLRWLRRSTCCSQLVGS